MAVPPREQALFAQLQACAELLPQKRYQEAEERLRALEAQHPFHAVVHFCLGVLYWETARQLEAVSHWRRSLASDPTYVPSMMNIARAMMLAGDLREALRYSQMAVRRRPDDSTLLSNLGIVLCELGKGEEAQAALRDALALDPRNQAARSKLAYVLELLGRDVEAIAEAQALLQQPDIGYHAGALVAIVNLAGKRSDWDLLERCTPLLSAAIRRPNRSGIRPMTMCWSEDDPALLHSIGEAEAQPALGGLGSARRWDGGRITVAYLSPDFGEHPVAHMLLPVLQAHDRDRVRIVLAATRPPADLPLVQALRQQADAILELSSQDDGDACRTLQEAGVDVIVDLCGGTRWGRAGILRRQPCQAQVLWLGCPATTGAGYYDAFLVDGTVAPPGYEAYCSEPLLRLPGCYHPLSTGHHGPLSTLTRSELGLPDGAVVVAMMQQPRKISPPCVDRVAEAVAAIPGAHLAVRVHQDSVDQAVARLVRLGLPRERLHIIQRFVSREDYLASLALVDVIVDTWPYGGHSTTGEALMRGTPVLAWLGRSIHARVAGSMLRELGLDDLIAADVPELMALLARHAATPATAQALRARAAAAAAAYREAGIRRLASRLEDAYAEVLRRTATPATPAP